MKKFITPAYTFTPGNSGVGTVNLTGITSFDVKNLVAIINQTSGEVIYATGQASTRYTAVAGNLVTLFYNTTSHSSGDTLQIIYEDNLVAQVVSASSLPLPTGASTETTLAALSAKLNSLGQKTAANSAPVVLASDQPAIPVTSGANTNGSNVDSTVGSVVTITKPANAVGFILMCLDTATDAIRWSIGSAASASSGQQLQAGRDSGYVPCGANVSICAQSGTQPYNIQWILSS